MQRRFVLVRVSREDTFAHTLACSIGVALVEFPELRPHALMVYRAETTQYRLGIVDRLEPRGVDSAPDNSRHLLGVLGRRSERVGRPGAKALVEFTHGLTVFDPRERSAGVLMQVRAPRLKVREGRGIPRTPAVGSAVEPLIQHTQGLSELGNGLTQGIGARLVLLTCSRGRGLASQSVANPTVRGIEEVCRPIEGVRDGIPVCLLALEEGTEVLGKRGCEAFVFVGPWL